MKRSIVWLGFVVLVAVTMSVIAPKAKAHFEGNKMYFSGGTLVDGSWGPNQSYFYSGQQVRHINHAENLYSESGVYPLLGFSTDVGSTGYVMPNKHSKIVGGDRYARNVAEGGGATGSDSLGISASQMTGSSDDDNQARKQAFYDLLVEKNGPAGSDWEKMGSSHIVHQLTKQAPNWGMRTIPASHSMWDDLKSRLVDNPDITMTYLGSYTTSHNTAGVQYGGNIDVIDVNKNGYYETSADLGPAWVFRDKRIPDPVTGDSNGKIVYMLQIICANPIGYVEGLDPPDEVPVNYTLTPTINIGSGLVNPGSSITASGTVSNDSTSNSNDNVRWMITRFEYSSNPSSTIRAAKPNSDSAPCVAFAGELAGCSDGTPYDSGDSQTISASGASASRSSSVSNDTPGGRYICFVTSVKNPTNSDSPVWSHSDMKCRKVRDFTLTPTISINSPSSLAEPGVAITGTGRVANSSVSDTSISRTWRITRYVYNKAPSSTVKSPVSGNASLDPCKAFERPSDGRLAGADGCDMTGSNRSTGGVSAGTNASGSFSSTAPNTGQGNDRRWVCFVASVQLPTEHPNSPAWAHSNMECKKVRNYDLIPEVGSTTGGSVVETGGDIKITTTVTNGSSVGSDETGSDIKWRVTKYVYTPESAKPTTSAHLATRTSNKGRNSQAPCPDDFIQPSFPGSCAEIWSQEEPLGTGTVSPINVDHPGFSVAVPDNYDVGTKLCFVASVSRPTANPNPIWRHSDMYCLTVGKSPKIHVWGGDVRSHGEIRTSLSVANNTRYGSWGEYGALSQGCNETQGFASGSGLLGGASMAGGLPRSSWSQLTFKNTGAGSCGGYGGYSLEPDFDAVYGAVSGQFEAGGAVRSNPSLQFTGGSLNSLNGLRWANSVTINTSSISSGRTVIIDAAGTVTINGNIQYANGGDDGYGSVSDIPQVIIRASNINISDNVTRVDAWLLTDGNLNTCSSIDVSSKYSLSDEDCDRPLEINGPVVAERVYLLRTRGADSTSRSEPAERFNLRADAYMWGSAFSADSGRIRTVYSRELPPRF